MSEENIQALVRQVQQIQDAQSSDHRRLIALVAVVEQLQLDAKGRVS